MPYGEYPTGVDEEALPPLIQSDINPDDVDRAEENVVEENAPASAIYGTSEIAGPSVVSLDNNFPYQDQPGEPTPAPASVAASMGEESIAPPSSVARKRGRPASATPAKSVSSRTPRSSKSATAPASIRGKRKADETVEEPEAEGEAEQRPAKKRGRPAGAGRPARVAPDSARLALKSSSRPKRGRPKSAAPLSTEPSQKPAKATKVRAKKAETNGAKTGKEYEVEVIVDSAINAETMEHMYFVKWQGYPASDNTWEPKSNLAHCMDLVERFEAENKKEATVEKKVAVAVKKSAAGAKKAGPEKKPAKRSAQKQAVQNGENGQVGKVEKKKAGRKPGRPSLKPGRKPGSKPGRKTRARA